MKPLCADYEALCGDRARNDFLSRLDLGITGAYESVKITMTFKDGEKVSVERAEKLCAVIKTGLNKSSPEIECESVKLLSVYRKP